MLRGSPLAIIPTGGSSALGAIGYVNAAFELAEQVRAGVAPEPDAIFVALGSGGTVAGLALGCRLAGLRTASSPSWSPTYCRRRPPAWSASRAAACAACARSRPTFPRSSCTPDDFTIVRDYVGPAYGAVTDAGSTAQRLLADEEGITLEPTYTAKCMAALLDLAARPPYREQTAAVLEHLQLGGCGRGDRSTS